MLKSLWHDHRDRNEASSPGSETRFEHVNKSLKNWGGKVYNSVHAILLVFQIIPALSSQEQAVSQTSTTHSSSSFSKFAISSTHTFPSWTQFHCSGQTWIWYQTPHYFASSGVLSHPGSTPTPCGDTFHMLESCRHPSSAFAIPATASHSLRPAPPFVQRSSASSYESIWSPHSSWDISEV